MKSVFNPTFKDSCDFALTLYRQVWDYIPEDLREAISNETQVDVQFLGYDHPLYNIRMSVSAYTSALDLLKQGLLQGYSNRANEGILYHLGLAFPELKQQINDWWNAQE